MTDSASAIRRAIGEFAGDFGVKADDKLFEALAAYAGLLVEWNTVHNLTSVTSIEKVAVRHFLDSMALLCVLPPGFARILDAGTGAGFPGLVLALCRPDIFVLAADATAKKVSFCKTVIARLKIENAGAAQARLGSRAAIKALGSGFDAVVSRAAMDAPLLVKIARPHLKDGGLVIAMKGESVADDRQALLQMAQSPGLQMGKSPGPQMDKTPGPQRPQDPGSDKPAIEITEKSYTLPGLDKARWLLVAKIGKAIGSIAEP
jgi:16S rRNA (guanine527-N7)-methyltransferase